MIRLWDSHLFFINNDDAMFFSTYLTHQLYVPNKITCFGRAIELSSNLPKFRVNGESKVVVANGKSLSLDR